MTEISQGEMFMFAMNDLRAIRDGKPINLTQEKAGAILAEGLRLIEREGIKNDEVNKLRAAIKRLQGRQEFHEYAISQWLTYEKDTQAEIAELRSKSIRIRPNWDDAPEWAEWVAMDKREEWYWYSNKPNCTHKNAQSWIMYGSSILQKVEDIAPYWKSTLEYRPGGWGEGEK